MSMFNQRAIKTGIDAVGNYLRASMNNLEAQQAHCCASNDAVAELEAKLRRHYQMKHAICVSNATTALFILGLALELKNCEFVTTPFTYGATIAGMLLLKNRPRFADIEEQTFSLNPQAAAQAVTPKTKAIISADIFGIPADSRALRQVADEHGLWFISDSSQSLGAKREGQPAGNYADALVVSFTAGKTLFAGEGGAIVTDNTELYEKLVFWSQHPLRQRRELGLHLDNEFAFNARISPLSAVWANAMFDFSLENLKLHQEKCQNLVDTVNNSGLTKQINLKKRGIESTFFRIPATWKNDSRESELTSFLASQNIRAKIESLPVRLLYQQPFLQTQKRLYSIPLGCPIAEKSLNDCFVINTFDKSEGTSQL